MTQTSGRQPKKERVEPIISLRARDGTMIETVFEIEKAQTGFIVLRDGKPEHERTFIMEGTRYVPFSARNNLLSHRVILLPSDASEYGSIEKLIDEVRVFIHRYVDLDRGFEEIAAHYVLLSWGYDVFNELPYLRVRGDYGSGKSRFLLTIGSLCYKPIFASGASTVSPLFRLIDQVGGTLIVDEADFWASDERAEIIKILNNGNARGFPVLRSEVTPSKEFSPRAFNIYGPKVIATRHAFQDEALESRCLTQELGRGTLRLDIPISLPRVFEAEAQTLRNKLLLYRFNRFANLDEAELDAEMALPPRRAQVLAPLLRIAISPEAKRRIIRFVSDAAGVSGSAQRAAEDRVLAITKSMIEGRPKALSLAEIAMKFSERWTDEYGTEVTPRWIGAILRRLGCCPQKSNGVFVVASTDYPHLVNLTRERVRDFGDERDMITQADNVSSESIASSNDAEAGDGNSSLMSPMSPH